MIVNDPASVKINSEKVSERVSSSVNGTWSIFFLLFLLQSWESVCYIWWPNAVFFYVSDEVNLNLQLIPKKGCCQVWSDSQICSITKEKEKTTNIY